MLFTDAVSGFADRPTDLLRLVVVPVFAWAAWRDVKTRRVTNRLWPPLLVLGVVLLALDVRYYHGVGGFLYRQFLIGTAISVLLVVPLVYVFWLLGGFGGADVKALATLAVVFPTFPTYFVGERVLPLVETHANAFAFTVLTNAVVVGLLYPLALGVSNLTRGERSRWMLFGRRCRWEELSDAHGRLLETPDGFTRQGLDVDALRMYLRWRGIDLADLRERADELRDPSTLPDAPNPPTDGAVATDGGRPSDDSSNALENGPVDETDPADEANEFDDPWGAAVFLEDIDHGAYGTDAETLRDGLDVVTQREAIWLSPGIPFIVPVFGGLLVALLYGDLLFGAMEWLGIV